MSRFIARHPANAGPIDFARDCARQASQLDPAFAGMTVHGCSCCSCLACSDAFAQDLLIRNATVHTATARARCRTPTCWCSDGRIARGRQRPAGAG